MGLSSWCYFARFDLHTVSVPGFREGDHSILLLFLGLVEEHKGSHNHDRQKDKHENNSGLALFTFYTVAVLGGTFDLSWFGALVQSYIDPVLIEIQADVKISQKDRAKPVLIRAIIDRLDADEAICLSPLWV